MFCAKCGTSNPDGASSCRSCHQALDAGSNVAAAVFDAGYAGFWRRYAAVFLDGLVVSLMFTPIAFIVGLIAGVLGLGQSIAFGAALYVLFFVAYTAYYVFMESGERGATFGKRWVKIRVVDVNGSRISAGRALGRFVGHLLSYITGYLGFLIQPFTARKQALHDMVSGTVIVKTEKEASPVLVIIIAAASALLIVAVIGILAAVAIPAYQGYIVKAKTNAALNVGHAATQAVQNYYAQTGKVPASIAETQVQLPPSPDVSAVEVNPANGEIHVIFSDKTPPAVAGKYLSFMPTQAADGSITWTCSSSEIPPGNLPQECR